MFPATRHSLQRATSQQMGRSTRRSPIHTFPIHCDLLALATQAFLTPARYPRRTSAACTPSTSCPTLNPGLDIPTIASVPTKQLAPQHITETPFALPLKKATHVEQRDAVAGTSLEFGNVVSARKLPLHVTPAACEGSKVCERGSELVPGVQIINCHVTRQIDAYAAGSPVGGTVPSGLSASEIQFERSVGVVCGGTGCALDSLNAQVVSRESLRRRMSELKEFDRCTKGMEGAQGRNVVEGRGEGDDRYVVLGAGVEVPSSPACNNVLGDQGCGVVVSSEDGGVEEMVVRGEAGRGRSSGEQGMTRKGKRRRGSYSSVSGAQFDKLISTGHIDKHLRREERRLLRYRRDSAAVGERRKRGKLVDLKRCRGKRI